MGGLPPEEGQQLVAVLSHLERGNIVLHAGCVLVLAQPVIAFIARDEGPQHAAVDEVLHGGEVRIIAVVVRDGRHVHVVQRGQVVEVQHVRLQEVGSQHDVPQQSAVGRHLVAETEGIVHGQGGGCRVRLRTHAADPLGQDGNVSGVPVAEDQLQPTCHGPAATRLGDSPAAAFDRHAKVPFNPRYRIYGDPTHPGLPRSRPRRSSASGPLPVQRRTASLRQ